MNFFGGTFFSGGFFGEFGGGARPGDGPKKRSIFKPTGTLHLPRKKLNPAQQDVENRLQDSQNIAADVAAQVSRDFAQSNRAVEQAAVASLQVRMSADIAAQAAMTAEIAILMQRKLRKEEEEMILLLMMGASL